MLIGPKRKIGDNRQVIRLHGAPLANVMSHRYLGVIIDSGLCFEKSLNDIVPGADTGGFFAARTPPPPTHPRLSAIFFLYSNPQMLIFPCPLNFIVVFSLPN